MQRGLKKPVPHLQNIVYHPLPGEEVEGLPSGDGLCLVKVRGRSFPCDHVPSNIFPSGVKVPWKCATMDGTTKLTS